MKSKIVTLIGSRKVPEHILPIMRKIGEYYRGNAIRRSGGAVGSDSIFIGEIHELDEIYRPKTDRCDLYRHFRVDDFRCSRIAEKLHPCYDELNEHQQALIDRNVCQIIGNIQENNTMIKSHKIIYYAPRINGQVQGGTRTAIRLAEKLNIPCYNLIDRDVMNYWKNKLNIVDGFKPLDI